MIARRCYTPVVATLTTATTAATTAAPAATTTVVATLTTCTSHGVIGSGRGSTSVPPPTPTPAATSGSGSKAPMNVVVLRGVPILDNLRIEETLYRGSTETTNWCILNTGSTPAVVLGLSRSPYKDTYLQNVAADSLPLIRRFSGGGSVYVDDKSAFVSFLMEKALVPDVRLGPQGIMEWSAGIYDPVLRNSGAPGLVLRENDYTFGGERKFAGNAQAISQHRFLHHTSFLWDYDVDTMSHYLTLPDKRPEYRASRSHADFLVSLTEYFTSPEAFVSAVISQLEETFAVRRVSVDDALATVDYALLAKKWKLKSVLLDSDQLLAESPTTK